MKEIGGEFLLPFRFRNIKGNRISHHLVFVSKHRKGYNIMKEIMAKAIGIYSPVEGRRLIKGKKE